MGAGVFWMNRFIAYDVSARTECTVRQKGRVVSLKHSTWRVVKKKKLRYEPVKLFMDVEITPASRSVYKHSNPLNRPSDRLDQLWDELMRAVDSYRVIGRQVNHTQPYFFDFALRSLRGVIQPQTLSPSVTGCIKGSAWQPCRNHGVHQTSVGTTRPVKT